MENQEDRLLDTQETIARLGISRKTLYNLMERGKIRPANEKPAFLSRRPKLQFRESDVDKLVNGTDEPKNKHAA